MTPIRRGSLSSTPGSCSPFSQSRDHSVLESTPPRRQVLVVVLVAVPAAPGSKRGARPWPPSSEGWGVGLVILVSLKDSRDLGVVIEPWMCLTLSNFLVG